MQKNDYGFGRNETVKEIDNQHNDEEYVVEDEQSVEIDSGEEDEDYLILSRSQEAPQDAQSSRFQNRKVPLPEDAYNPNDYLIYKQVQKSNNCQSMSLQIKIFIPDYVLAIDDIDTFIKISRPDGQPETLGLVTLVFLLYNFTNLLLANSKRLYQNIEERIFHSSKQKQKYNQRAIENEITAWINDVAEMHKKKQPPSVLILQQCLISKNQCGHKNRRPNYQVTIMTWADKNIANSPLICQIFLFIQLLTIEIYFVFAYFIHIFSGFKINHFRQNNEEIQ
ncbi:unnamed protein product [Paramecium octaurelia]|uniref:Uncharacterized protein n=1 Tax=Paramecium octaurelia TaxID=43137 RepID=A0A8S1WQQ8_PAROT|nr:unnamed protein product [Paramecium octaurelia]CAD8192340.1 unnamed protein product [Paramecium octaurelia]